MALLIKSPTESSSKIISSLSHSRADETHSRLAGYTCGDDNDLSACQRLRETVILREIAIDLCWGRDVREIGGDTGSVDDIVKAQLANMFQLVCTVIVRL
jgi:hypothetical protein